MTDSSLQSLLEVGLNGRKGLFLEQRLVLTLLPSVRFLSRKESGEEALPRLPGVGPRIIGVDRPKRRMAPLDG